MKTMKISLLSILMCLLTLSVFSQNAIRNTIYVSPGMNMPGRSFGYPTNAPNASLNTLGAGFNAGMIFYFNDNDAELGSLINFGLDFTVAEFVVNRNIIVAPDNQDQNEWFWNSSDPELSSIMMSMKIGPVVTIVPQSKVGIDIYAQGMLGLSTFDFLNTETQTIDSSPNLTPQYRIASGIRVGYHVLYLNLEYSWGEPVIRKASGSNVPGEEVSEFTIDQSFIRLGLTFKFTAFK